MRSLRRAGEFMGNNAEPCPAGTHAPARRALRYNVMISGMFTASQPPSSRDGAAGVAIPLSGIASAGFARLAMTAKNSI
ncbi:MAG TPA: hypothetical protein VIH40_02650 [Xanthobacteraceae bacterium]